MKYCNIQTGTRRDFLQRLGHAGAAYTLGLAGGAKAGDDPPFFETARHQFTLLDPRKPPAPVTFQHFNGHPASLAEWHGKVILLNFWASWCPQCRTELPVLDRLQASLDPARYQVLAVSTDHEGKAAVDPFVKALDLRHLELALDPAGALGRPMQSGLAPAPNPSPFTIYGMPMSYVIDTAGRVCGYLIGAADWTSPEARALLRYYETS
jgi:thiol-disulfide isomerase/thioredoxin